MPKLIKKILLIYISIVLTLAPSSVFASSVFASSAGGWAFSSFDVAKSVVTAMKNGASASVAVAKSPITSKIAKGIVGGAIAGAALPLAISQLTGIALSAVDWVLDPANNAIKYRNKNPPAGYYYAWSDSRRTQYSTAEEAGRVACDKNSQTFVNVVDTYPVGAQRVACRTSTGSISYQYISFEGVVPDNTYKSIPIPTVADKIYDNAKTDTASASVVNDAVKDYVNEGSADTALDNAKADADSSHACGTGTHWSGSACVADTPTTPTDTPFDPSGIIDAIKSVFDAVKSVFDAVMSLPDVINNALDSLLVDIKDFFQPVLDKVTDMIDWFKSDPDPQSDNKPDINDTRPTKSAQDFDSNYINFGGQCPSFSPTTISVGIVAVPISFNAQPLCDFAILCRPIILALAYFAAMAIVANAIRSE